MQHAAANVLRPIDKLKTLALFVAAAFVNGKQILADPGSLAGDVLHALLFEIGLDFVLAGSQLLGEFRCRRFDLQFLFFAGSKHARERVVIGRRDRIELMVVAPRAADGQAEQAATDDVDAVVDDVVLVVQESPAERQEAERGQRPLVRLRRANSRRPVVCVRN